MNKNSTDRVLTGTDVSNVIAHAHGLRSQAMAETFRALFGRRTQK